LHATKAALLVHGIDVKRHASAKRLFGQLPVQKGEIEKEWAEILAHEQIQRDIADYIVSSEIEKEDAEVMVRDARNFSKRIKIYLEQKGVLSTDDNLDKI
jgi:uncharacterized protein (UPF0332 family)